MLTEIKRDFTTNPAAESGLRTCDRDNSKLYDDSALQVMQALVAELSGDEERDLECEVTVTLDDVECLPVSIHDVGGIWRLIDSGWSKHRLSQLCATYRWEPRV